MIVAMTKPLFAWDCLEDSPGLWNISRFEDVLGQEPHPCGTSSLYGGRPLVAPPVKGLTK